MLPVQPLRLSYVIAEEGLPEVLSAMDENHEIVRIPSDRTDSTDKFQKIFWQGFQIFDVFARVSQFVLGGWLLAQQALFLGAHIAREIAWASCSRKNRRAQIRAIRQIKQHSAYHLKN